VLAAIQREAKADDDRTGRSSRRASFADDIPRTRQRAKQPCVPVSLAEPSGDWHPVALTVARETADPELREQRVDAIQSRNSWSSLGDTFRQSIIARCTPEGAA
jgi:hypothetical protein